jgi:hypothetical protein
MRAKAVLLIVIAVLLVSGVAWRPEAAAGPTELTACGTITQPGSYVLANNLTSSSDCLVIDADFVTVDLNGFLIQGAGTGTGIVNPPSVFTHKGLTVRNGTIVGFVFGINAVAEALRVEGVYVTGNTSHGIVMGQFSGSGIVKDSIVTDNGGEGIVASSAVVTGNVVLRNGTNSGIDADHSTIIGNTVNDGQTGINGHCAGGGGTIVANAALSNAVKGYVHPSGCTTAHNSN